jgi:3-deoxy-D-manno-octulosonate 8-phosphate phosphatase (KDO 8-P phosphatase)
VIAQEAEGRERIVSIETKAAVIKLLLFDVDGVLTDGKILLHPDGTESKRFDIKDGTALVWAQRAGLKVGVLSARTSAATAQRAAQLGVTIVYQGVPSKLHAYDDILRQQQLTDAETAYMGDDLLDLPVIARVGLSACPADAADEVRSRVDFVSRAVGGDGAAREFVETVLKAQDRWETLLGAYTGQAAAAGPGADVAKRRASRS